MNANCTLQMYTQPTLYMEHHAVCAIDGRTDGFSMHSAALLISLSLTSLICGWIDACKQPALWNREHRSFVNADVSNRSRLLKISLYFTSKFAFQQNFLCWIILINAEDNFYGFRQLNFYRLLSFNKNLEFSTILEDFWGQNCIFRPAMMIWY